jgi:hypothetical protein
MSAVRAWLTEVLRRPAAVRASAVLGLATALAEVFAPRRVPGASGWVAASVLAVGSGLVTMMLAFWPLGYAARLANPPAIGPAAGGRPRPLAAGLLLAAVGAGVLWVLWQQGPGGHPDRSGAALVLVEATLLVFGYWACRLLHRRVARGRHRIPRLLPYALAAGLLAVGIRTFASPDLLAPGTLAGLLGAPGGWAAYRTWRAMSAARVLAARAGADLVFALLLGADAVLLLVWLANLLRLPPAEVAVLRGALEWFDRLIDLPWWVWTVAYVLLAAASVLLVIRPRRLARALDRLPVRLRRAPVVPVLGSTRRVLEGVHFGLIVAVLVGLSAPAAVAPALRGQLKATYTVALARELDADGAAAAYEAIRQAFPPPNPAAGTGPRPVTPLVDIIDRIHRTDPPPPGSPDATPTERGIARRIGALQGDVVTRTEAPLGDAPVPPVDTGPPGDTGPPVDTGPAVAADVAAAGFDDPLRDATDLRGRLGTVQAQRQDAAGADARVERAADLAATALASLVPLADLGLLGANELVQIAKEYVQGLVEGSFVKTVFAAWIRRLPGAERPPDAAGLVVPNLPRLLLRSYAALFEQRGRVRVADPFTPDPVQARVRAEDPAAGIVDLTNETRYLDENGTGRCDGCPRPVRPGEERLPGRPGEPGEPRRPPELPRPHIR